MIIERRGCFTRKTYDNYLYTWCPEKNVTKNTGANLVRNKNRRDFVTLPPNQMVKTGIVPMFIKWWWMEPSKKG